MKHLLFCTMTLFILNTVYAEGRIESTIFVEDEAFNNFPQTHEGDQSANEAVIIRMRRMQINLREIGCDRTEARPSASPVMTSPSMFERTSKHEFSVSSNNCKIVSSTDSCGAGFRKNITQPSNADLKKITVCVKSEED